MDFLGYANETGQVGSGAGVGDWDNDVGGTDFSQGGGVDGFGVDPGDEIGRCLGEFGAVGHCTLKCLRDKLFLKSSVLRVDKLCHHSKQQAATIYFRQPLYFPEGYNAL